MRKLKKIPFFLDIEFADFISQEQIKEVAEKVALALKQAVESGQGLAPNDESTITNKVRIMCKDVVLLQEDYTKLDGQRHVTVQDIQGVAVEDPLKEKCEGAVEILKSILTESGVECEYDQEIFSFLKENNDLPDNFVPYWEDDED